MYSVIQGRVRQTLQYILAWLWPIQDNQARAYLTPAEFDLFLKMSPPERQHHLRVFNTLLDENHSHPALLKAALLHDVGKIRYSFGLLARILVVLVRTVLPGKFVQWSQSQENPESWKLPFVISARHPDWSAEMAESAGTEPLTIELIRRHQTPLNGSPRTEADRLLLLLQAADNKS